MYNYAQTFTEIGVTSSLDEIQTNYIIVYNCWFSLLAHMVITIVTVKGNLWIPSHQPKTTTKSLGDHDINKSVRLKIEQIRSSVRNVTFSKFMWILYAGQKPKSHQASSSDSKLWLCAYTFLGVYYHSCWFTTLRSRSVVHKSKC